MKKTSDILIYQTLDGDVKIDVRLDDETVWLNQEQMGRLFGKARTTITGHIRNIFKEGELIESMVCRDFRHTTHHGAIKGKTQSKSVKYYNLDVVISVGYRVKSFQGTQFRIWATQRLKECLVQGYSINKQRFEQNAAELHGHPGRTAWRVYSEIWIKPFLVNRPIQRLKAKRLICFILS